MLAILPLISAAGRESRYLIRTLLLLPFLCLSPWIFQAKTYRIQRSFMATLNLSRHRLQQGLYILHEI